MVYFKCDPLLHSFGSFPLLTYDLGTKDILYPTELVHVNIVFLSKNPCLEKFHPFIWPKTSYQDVKNSCHANASKFCMLNSRLSNELPKKMSWRYERIYL